MIVPYCDVMIGKKNISAARLVSSPGIGDKKCFEAQILMTKS